MQTKVASVLIGYCFLHGMEKVLMVVSRFYPCHAGTGVLFICLADIEAS